MSAGKAICATSVVQDALANLSEKPNENELAVAARTFAQLAAGLDVVSREVARDGFVRALGARGVNSPARIVDAALSVQSAVAAAVDEADVELLEDVEPWSHPVDGCALLEELGCLIRSHIVLSEHAAVAVALWIVFTHCIDVVETSPRLATVSPTKRCGKTTLFSFLVATVRRPLPASNVSTAAIYRVIEADGPTLILDEGDTFLQEREELRGILNSGHTKDTAFVLRCEGSADKKFKAVRYSTWAAIAVAAIGRDSIPSTLLDRSVVIQLERRKADQKIVRWRDRDRGTLARLRRQCARWVADNEEALRKAPVLDELNDRAADSWSPLLAVAYAAGGRWPEKARAAAFALSVDQEGGTGDPGDELLAAIRDALGEEDRIKSSKLAEKLAELEDRPWSTLTPHKLAHKLKPFGIRPVNIRFGDHDAGRVAKGYFASAFADALGRYLATRKQETPKQEPPTPPSEPLQPLHDENHSGSGANGTAT